MEVKNICSQKQTEPNSKIKRLILPKGKCYKTVAFALIFCKQTFLA